MSLEVLYCDNHLLAVVKPPGLVVQGARADEPSLADQARTWLKERYSKPGNVFLGVVHRLDRPVGGVVLFARTSKAAGRLSEQFRGRRVRKVYRAVVEGGPPARAGVLEGQVALVDGRPQLVQDEGAGVVAHLRYSVVARGGGRTELTVELGTGRKHQIRLQLAAVGAPIVGDRRYGAGGAPLERAGAIALFAERLVVTHPTTGVEVDLHAPLPDWWPSLTALR